MDMVDVAFSLSGGTIPADHGWRLFQLLAERLDWLADEPDAGVHPIRGSRAVAGEICRESVRNSRSRCQERASI